VAAFIAAQRERFGIPQALSCRALGVSQSWFYKWKDGTLPPRVARRARLAAEVARLFALHDAKYGAPRITADLRDAGWRVSQNTVAAVMREEHLAARGRKKRRATTRPGKGRWRAPDLVKRDFPADRINRKWFGDGTEIQTTEGKLHLASVMDVVSRRIVGFALGEHHDAQLAYGAMAMAIAVRGGSVPGVILHTDQGSEYTAGAFRQACQRLGVQQSMGRGPGRRWTTRSSSPGTPPWSSSSGRWSSSPPGPQPGSGWRRGSRTTTTTGGIRPAR
jgi:putative transposase